MLRHPQVTYGKKYWVMGWHNPVSPKYVTGYLLQCPPKYVTGWNGHGTWNMEHGTNTWIERPDPSPYIYTYTRFQFHLNVYSTQAF